MPAPSAPNPELLSSLGRLVRGLSTLFWGLPIALITCIQTAKGGEWLREFGVLPPVVATALLCYGLNLLGHFQKQERIWRSALDRAKIFAFLTLGFSPFLFWWSRLPANPFFLSIVILNAFSALLLLLTLNPVLLRLTAMLPDETMRAETKLFTSLNRYLLSATIALLTSYLLVKRIQHPPQLLIKAQFAIEQSGLWLALFFILLPLAMTMALLWKIKEIILSSIFGPDH